MMILTQRHNENELNFTKLGTIAIGIGIWIGIGISVGSVETVLHIIKGSIPVGIGVGIGVGIRISQCKHTIRS